MQIPVSLSSIPLSFSLWADPALWRSQGGGGTVKTFKPRLHSFWSTEQTVRGPPAPIRLLTVDYNESVCPSVFLGIFWYVFSLRKHVRFSSSPLRYWAARIVRVDLPPFGSSGGRDSLCVQSDRLPVSPVEAQSVRRYFIRSLAGW